MKYKTAVIAALTCVFGLFAGTASATGQLQYSYGATFESSASTDIPLNDFSYTLDTAVTGYNADGAGWFAGSDDGSKIAGVAESQYLDIDTGSSVLSNRLSDATKDFVDKAMSGGVKDGIRATETGIAATVESKVKFVPSDSFSPGYEGGTDASKFAIYAYCSGAANSPTNVVLYHAYLDNDALVYTNEVFSAVNIDSSAFHNVTIQMKKDGTAASNNLFSVKIDNTQLTSLTAFDAEGSTPGSWFRTTENTSTEANKAVSGINFKGTGQIDDLAVGGVFDVVTRIPVQVPTAISLTYNGAAQVGVATGTGYTITDNAATAAGSYMATATLAEGYCWDLGNEEYSLAPQSISWSIARKPATITVSNASKVYGESDPAFTGTVSGLVNDGDLGTITYSRTGSDSDVGTYSGVLTASYTEENANYTVTVTPGNFEITPATAVIPVAAANLVYSGVERTGVSTGTGYTLSGNTATAAGSYKATATLAANYKWSDDTTAAKEIDWSIGQAPLSVTAKAKSITYGDAPANDGVTYSGFVNGETESVLAGTLAYGYNYEQYGNVGNSYTITPSGLSSSNYAITFESGTLTVAAKALTLTADSKTVDHGAAVPTYTYTANGLVNNDALSTEPALSCEYVQGSAIGNYPIAISGAAASANYAISYVPGTLTVQSKTYNVTFVDDDNTTVLKAATAYEYGTAAADIEKPADPTKEATAEYTYTFSGWTPAIADVTADATYTAAYTSAKRKYTLTINYVVPSGYEAPASYSAEVENGAEYSVPSPAVANCTPDVSPVSGTMPTENRTVTVTYTANAATVISIALNTPTLGATASSGRNVTVAAAVGQGAGSGTAAVTATAGGESTSVTPVNGIASATFAAEGWNAPVDWTISGGDAELAGRTYAKAEGQWFSTAAADLDEATGFGDGVADAAQPAASSAAGEAVRVQMNITVQCLDTLPSVADIGDARGGIAATNGAFVAFNGATWVELAGVTPVDDTDIDLLMVADFENGVQTMRYYVNGVSLYAVGENDAKVYAIPMKSGADCLAAVGVSDKALLKSAITAEQDVSYIATIGDNAFTTVADLTTAIAAALEDGNVTVNLLKALDGGSFVLPVGKTATIVGTWANLTVTTADGSFVTTDTTTSGRTVFGTDTAIATVITIADAGATTNTVGTYASLAEAVAAAPSGSTVVLLADVALSSTVILSQDLTIDLNGNDIAATDARALWIKSGDVTLAGEGTVSANGAGLAETSSVIRLGDSAAIAAAAKLTIGADVTVASSRSYGVTVFGKNSDGDDATTDIALDVYGTVAVTSAGEADAAIAGNGSSGLSAVDVTIRDGAVVSATNQAGIYFPGAGTLSIEGGSITAPTAVYAKAGTVAVSGGTLTATGAKADYQYYGNGPKATGDALVLDNCGYPNGTTFAASITGGTFVSANGKSVASYAKDENYEPLADFIPATVGGQPNPARFSDAETDGVPAGYSLVLVEGSDPALYEVSPLAAIQYYNSWSVPNVFYFEDEDPIPVRTTQATVPTIKRTGETSYHAAEDWVVKTWTVTASTATDASTPDATIATVDANGLVTFTAPGTVKVWLTMTDPSGAVKSAYKAVSYKTAPAWTVSADGNTRTAYATLLSAFNAAQDGERVVLGADASVGNIGRMTLNADKAVTLDLNGRTVTLTGNYREDSGVALFTVKQGSLTVVDTAETKGGIVASGANARAFNVDGTARAAATDAVLTIGEGVNVSSATECCVVIVGKATLNTAGNLSAPADFAIAGNGSAGNGGTVINVTGGTVSGDEVAIYQPQDGTLTISGGTITGDTAVYVKSGSVSVTGGTLTGTGAAADYTFNGNGANATGDALVIDNCGYPGGNPTASITGGTFVSQNAKSVGSYAKDDTFTALGGFIPGTSTAMFSDADADGVPAGYALKEVPDSDPTMYSISQIFVVTYVNYDGTVLQVTTNFVNDVTPAYTGETPTRPADAQYSYSFSGWGVVAETVTAAATYTAQFSETVKQYTVIWVADGNETTNVVEYGTTVASIKPGDPAKAGDENALYTFTGWSPAIADGDTVTADTTYTAGFKTWAKVAAPTAATGLVYNGSEQTGVAAGTGYTLSGTAAATAVGNYSATATLADAQNTVWADATVVNEAATAAKTIDWAIGPKAVTVTADSKSKIAGNADPELTATVEGTIGTDTVAYTLSRESGDAVGEYAITVTGEAVQGNYAVTFVNGKLTITGSAASVIIIVDNEPVETFYASFADAMAAAVSGSTVKLYADVALDARVEPNLGANTTLTIDLGGKTITRTGTSGNGSAFDVKSGDVTIMNGTIDCTQDDTDIAADGVYAITSRSGSNVTLADLAITVNSECGACAYPFAGSTMTIESGTYANTTTTPYRYNTAITGMAVNQPNIADQLLIIKGGSFSQYDPQLGDDSGAMTDFTDDGFVAIADGNGNWVVQEGYNVTFDANGGTPEPAAQRVAKDGKATEPTGVAKEHYSLRAWKLGENDYDFDTVLTGDVTLVADWKLDTFTVIWVADGNETTNVVEYGTTVADIKPGDPAKAGDENALYTFVGWTPAQDATVTSNATYTAQFKTWAKVAAPTAATGLVYNGSEQTGVAAGDGYTLSGTAAATAAGNYSATATLAADSVWSDATVVDEAATAAKTIDWAIARASVNVTAEDKTQVYGAAEVNLTYTAGELASGDSFSGALARGKGSDVGTYTIGIGTLTAGDNYTINFTEGTYTITQASIAITVTGTASSATYTGVEQTGTVAYTLASNDALYDAAKVQFSGAATVKGTNFGNYPYGLVASQFAYNDQNVAATFSVTDANFTINKASIAIAVTGTAASAVYDGTAKSADVAYTLASNDALYDEAKVVYSGDATVSGTDAGTYAFGLAAEKFSYNDANVEATFTVTDAALTITRTAHTVIWVVNGETVETDADVLWGTKPSYDGNAPTKEDEQYDYTFVGWTGGNVTEPVAAADLPNVTGDVTYTAQFTSTPKAPTVISIALTKPTLNATGASGKSVVVTAELVKSSGTGDVSVTPDPEGTVSVADNVATATFAANWNQGVEWTLSTNGVELAGKTYLKAENTWFTKQSADLGSVTGFGNIADYGVAPENHTPAGEAVRVQARFECDATGYETAPDVTEADGSRAGIIVVAGKYTAFNGTGWVELAGATPTNGEVDVLMVCDPVSSTVRYYIDGVALYAAGSSPRNYEIPMKSGDAYIESVAVSDPAYVKGAVTAEYDVSYRAAAGTVGYVDDATAAAAADKTGETVLELLASGFNGTITLGANESVKVANTNNFAATAGVAAAEGYRLNAAAGEGSVVVYTVELATPTKGAKALNGVVIMAGDEPLNTSGKNLKFTAVSVSGNTVSFEFEAAVFIPQGASTSINLPVLYKTDLAAENYSATMITAALSVTAEGGTGTITLPDGFESTKLFLFGFTDEPEAQAGN